MFLRRVTRPVVPPGGIDAACCNVILWGRCQRILSAVFEYQLSFFACGLRRRIEYLERVVPAVTRLQRMWRTVRERAFVADMRWLCIRVQSHARRILLVQEQKKLQPLKNFFFGAVVMAGIAYAFRRLGLSDEVVHSIEMK